MRNRSSNKIDGMISGMDRRNGRMIDRSVETQQDIEQRDAAFFRDDIWRLGAFQLSNFLDINDLAMIGREGGTKVGR